MEIVDVNVMLIMVRLICADGLLLLPDMTRAEAVTYIQQIMESMAGLPVPADLVVHPLLTTCLPVHDDVAASLT